MNTSSKVQSIDEIKEDFFKRFKVIEIQLKDISQEVLAISPKVANEKAAKHELPFPTHRLRPRAPWLVTLDDLARAIFIAREQAKKDWQEAQDKPRTARG